MHCPLCRLSFIDASRTLLSASFRDQVRYFPRKLEVDQWLGPCVRQDLMLTCPGSFRLSVAQSLLQFPPLPPLSVPPAPFGHRLELYGPNMASVRIADEALTGFAKSSLYDQHRPSYSNEAVERLLTSLRVAGVHAASILDLAAGTGKFTDVLAQRSEKFNICAVEPRSEMRTELERKSFPNVIVKGGLAKSIPLEEESVDAVIAAQVRLQRLRQPFSTRL